MGAPCMPLYGYTNLGSAMEDHDRAIKKIKAGIATAKDLEIFENSGKAVVEYWKKENENHAD